MGTWAVLKSRGIGIHGTVPLLLLLLNQPFRDLMVHWPACKSRTCGVNAMSQSHVFLILTPVKRLHQQQQQRTSRSNKRQVIQSFSSFFLRLPQVCNPPFCPKKCGRISFYCCDNLSPIERRNEVTEVCFGLTVCSPDGF